MSTSYLIGGSTPGPPGTPISLPTQYPRPQTSIPDSLDYITFIILVVFAGAFLFCYVLNILVIYITAKYSEMRTVTNLYISNVALVHLLFMSGVPLLAISFLIKGSWPLNDFHCKLHFFLSGLYKMTGPLFILALVVDRYFLISCSTGEPRIRSKCCVNFIVISIWVLACICIAPFVPFTYVQYEEQEKPSCNVWTWFEDGLANVTPIFLGCTFVVGFLIPIIPTLIFYCKLTGRVETIMEMDVTADSTDLMELQAQTENDQHPQADGEAYIRSRIEVLSRRPIEAEESKLVLALAKAHFICWIPYWIIVIPIFFYNKTTAPYVILTYAIEFLNAVNSLINPFLCFCFSKKFKRNLRRTCGCCMSQER